MWARSRQRQQSANQLQPEVASKATSIGGSGSSSPKTGRNSPGAFVDGPASSDLHEPWHSSTRPEHLFPFSCLPATLIGIVRYTTFRFALAPTPAQASKLARHAGASRFAYNQCLQLVKEALDARRVGPHVRVPWSRFDLINGFNGWKNSEDAGRMFVVTSNGTIDKHVTGLPWRREVSAQVVERLQSTAPGRLPTFETLRAAHVEAGVLPSQSASAKAAAVTVSGCATSSTGLVPS
jgi:Helix-turn-helix domain